MLVVEPPQQAAFVAGIAAPAAVQSTRARWLAAVCSTAALRAPKARRRHHIVVFFRFGCGRAAPRPADVDCSSPREAVILRWHGAQRCYVNTALPFVAQPQRPTYLQKGSDSHPSMARALARITGSSYKLVRACSQWSQTQSTSHVVQHCTQPTRIV